MFLGGKIEPKYMTEREYELLLDYECHLAKPNSQVLGFCRDGMVRLGVYDEYSEFFVRAEKAIEKNSNNLPYMGMGIGTSTPLENFAPPNKAYSKTSYANLHDLFVKGELYHEHMEQSDYERLLSQESDFENKSNEYILEFCANGLKQYEEYAHLSDIEIYLKFMAKNIAIHDAERSVLERFRTPKNTGAIAEIRSRSGKKSERKQYRLASMIVAIVTISVLALTVVAFGYSFETLLRRALETPGVPVIDDDTEIIVAVDTRTYDSKQELLYNIPYNILYPAYLPESKSFTDFYFDDFGVMKSIIMKTDERYITFNVNIGRDFLDFEEFEYEINGIKFNVFEFDGVFYQASWVCENGFSYSLVVKDREIIPKIMENLKQN